MTEFSPASPLKGNEKLVMLQGDQQIAVPIGTALQAPGGAGVPAPFAATLAGMGRYIPSRRIRIVCGLDSLTNGAGTVSSSYRQYLLPMLRAQYGDCGPGMMAFDNNHVPNGLGNSAFFIGGGTAYISTLAWTDPIRQKALYGLGCYTTGTTVATLSCVPTASDPWVANVIACRITFELTATGDSIKWRQNTSTETTATETTLNEAAGYALNTLYAVERPVTAAKGAVGCSLYSMVGNVRVYSVEFVSSAPGATLMDLGLGGQKASEWALMDDTRARLWTQMIRPDLTIIDGGMNDRVTDSATVFSKTMNTIVPRWQDMASNNILLVRPNDSSDVATTNLKDYAPVLQSIANGRRCDYIDDRAALGTYAQALAAGYMDSDAIHPTQTGNTARAAAYFSRIMAASAPAAYIP